MSRLSGVCPEVMLRNAYPQIARQRKYRGMPFWVFVSLITGCGSTVSAEICRELGWNPEQPIGTKLPPRSAAQRRAAAPHGMGAPTSRAAMGAAS